MNVHEQGAEPWNASNWSWQSGRLASARQRCVIKLAGIPAYVNWYHHLVRAEVVTMMAMSASEARKRLFPLIEQVNDDQEPVEIVSKAGTAYLVSADQWRSLMETAHLLRSPANAERLLRSIADAEAGRTEVQELLDPQHDVS
jgi:antitoxin YefM